LAIELSVNISVNRLDEIKRIPEALVQAFAKISADMTALQAKTSTGNTTLIRGLQQLADQTIKAVTAQGTLNTVWLQAGQANTAYTQTLGTVQGASQKVVVGVNAMTGAERESIASLQEAIRANTSYAQSLASIEASAKKVASQRSGSNLGGASLTGAGAESVQSLQQAYKAGVQYQQALVAIGEAERQFRAEAETSKKVITAGFGEMTAAVSAFFVAFRVTGGLVNFIQEVTLTAARTEVLGTVLGQVARTAGISTQESQKYVAQVKALGITTQEASTVITRFIQNNLDLTKATQLARVAQDAAAISGQNSSEALQGLLHAVLTLQPEIFRTYGLTVNLEQAYRSFAQQTGRTVESLTLAEKQQVALTQTLTQGARIAGVYTAAMGDAGKQLLSMARFQEEAANALGRAFLPGLRAGVSAVTELLIAVNALSPAMQSAISTVVAMGAAIVTLSAIASAGAVAVGLINAQGIALGATLVKLATGPIGIIILALATLVGGYVAYTSAVDRSTEAQRQAFKEMSPLQRLFTTLQGTTADLGKAFTEVAAKTNRTVGETSFLAAAMRELQQRFPELRQASDQTGQTFQDNVKRTQDFTAELAKQEAQVGLLTKAWNALKSINPSNIFEGLKGTVTGADILSVQKAAQAKVNVGVGEIAGDLAPIQDFAAISLNELKLFIAQFNQAESSFDVTKLQGKVEQYRMALRVLTEPIAGVSRAQQLKEFGFVDAQGKLLEDAEKRAQIVAKNMAQALRKAQSETLGITTQTEQARAQLEQAGAQQRLQQAESALQQRLQQISNAEAAELHALEQQRNQHVSAAEGNAAAIQQIDERAGIRRAEIAVETEQKRVEAQQAALPQIQKLREAELNAEKASLDRQVQAGLISAEQAAAQRAVIQAQLLESQASTNTKQLALDTDLYQKQTALEAQRTKVQEAEQAKRLKLEEQAVKALQSTLEGRQQVIDAEKGLIQAQVEGEVITKQEGLNRFKALQEKDFENQIRRMESLAEARRKDIEQNVTDEELKYTRLQEVDNRFAADKQALEIRQQTERQQLLNEESEGLRHFVERATDVAGDFLFNLFDGQITGIKDLLTSLKQFFFKTIADMIAYAVLRPIIISVATQFLGAFGTAAGGAAGGAGGGAAGGGFDLSTLLSLGKQAYNLYGDSSSLLRGFSSTISSLDNTMTSLLYGVEGLQSSVDAAALSFDVGIPTGSAASPAFSTLGVAGGLAAVGGGIYGALNANNSAAQAAYAASSAAGAFAAASASGLMAAAIGTATTTGFTGYGLIAAAVLAAIGMILDQFIKPGGPRLVVGQLQGSSIGVESGQLVRQGTSSASTVESEKLGDDVATKTADALSTGVDQMIDAMLKAINEVAIDPEALLGSTQQALEEGIAGALTLNSANAKRLEEDIKEQLAFIPIQIGSSFLAPLNEAFQQLTTADLDTQIRLLPAASQGMVNVLKTFNVAIAELEKVANDDVERNLSPVKTRVTAFMQNFANDLTNSLKAALTGPQENFFKGIVLAAAIPQEVAALTPELAGIVIAAQQLAPVLSALVKDIDSLTATLTPTADKLADVKEHMDETAEEILRLSDSLTLVIPLFEVMRQDIIANAALQIQLLQEQHAQFIETAQAAVDAQQDVLDAYAEVQDAAEEAHEAALDAIQAQRDLLDAQKAVLDVEQARIDAARDAVDDQQKLLDLQQKALDQQTKAIDGQQKALDQQTKAIDLQQTALDQQTKVIDLQQKALDQQTKAIDLQQKALNQQREAIGLQQDALNQQREELQGLRDEIAARQDSVQSLQQSVESLTQLSQQVQGLVRGGQAPAVAAGALRSRIAELQAQLSGQTGEQQIDTLNQLVELNNELVALGQSTNQLDLQKEGNDGLIQLQQQIDQQLQLTANQLSTEEAQLAAMESSLSTQEAALDLQQQGIDTQLAALELQQQGIDAQIEALELQQQGIDAQRESIDLQQQGIDAQRAGIDLQQQGIDAQRDAVALQQDALDLQQEGIDAQLEALAAQQETLDVAYDALQAQYDALQIQEDAENARFTAQMDVFFAQLEAEQALLDALNEQLTEAQDTTTLNEQIKAIQEATLSSLQALESQIQALYLSNLELVNLTAQPPPAVQATSVQPLPLPVNVVASISTGGGADQQEQLGGLVSGLQWGGPLRAMQPQDLVPMQRFAMGGMTHIMAEPGELVFKGPLSGHQLGALATVNDTWPRFMVGGSGDGDSVPLRVPTGSFVMNRKASKALISGGYQSGGTVEPTGAPITITVNVIVNAVIKDERDIRSFANELSRHVERQLTTQLGRRR